MHRVTFQQDEITYDAEEGQWLYDVCEAAGASVPFACKAGAWGTCATQVVQGEESLGPQKAREIRTLESNGLDPSSIDSCAWRTFTERSPSGRA
jgi:ferredoxin